VIVLNGGSSSGKSGIARCLQAVLPDPWLAVGDDMLIQAMPASMPASDAGIEFAADGRVSVGPGFRRLEAAWMDGVAAIARAGAGIIVDEIFLGGAQSQQRWQKALAGLNVLWVAVRCEPAVAAAASSPGETGSAGWPCRKRRWSTRAWSMTWRWTLHIPSPWHVRGLSLPVSRDRRLGRLAR
jgi:chloramphenicol 3-O phosphotransferase